MPESPSVSETFQSFLRSPSSLPFKIGGVWEDTIPKNILDFDSWHFDISRDIWYFMADLTTFKLGISMKKRDGFSFTTVFGDEQQ